MNIETEIPEPLFNEMNDFIESNLKLDQTSFIGSALTNFLFENGCEDRTLLDIYLNEIFDKSPSQYK